jgi:hypothetical protein
MQNARQMVYAPGAQNGSRTRQSTSGGHPLLLIGLAGLTLSVAASEMANAQDGRRTGGIAVKPEKVVMLEAIVGRPGGSGPVGGGVTDCAQSSSHSDFSNYQNPIGQSVVVQAGFAQGESTAATYTLLPSQFPIKINTIETLFATSNSTTVTQTRWSVTVWQGPPHTGTVVATYASDGDILPHLVLPAGNAAGIIQFGIDPSHPEQIIVQNNGSNTFSIGFRIEQHNNQTGNPCLTGPATCCNAFPATDTSGLANAAGNWLFGLNCGQFGCPPNGGWARFSQLGFCTPSGDWILRTNWQSVSCSPGIGACCLPNGTCEISTQTNCTSQNGLYRGDGTDCATANCPLPTGACCFSNGNCLNLTEANCGTAGGSWLGGGTACNGGACPLGACCLPSGQCVGGISSASCTAQGGSFQGVGTQCSGVNCPQPTGACCIGTGCLQLTSADCAQIPQSFWAGALSQCGPSPHAPCCYANCDGSTVTPILNVDDFTCFINRFAAADAWANCDGSTTAPILNVDDFTCFINRFAAGCP